MALKTWSPSGKLFGGGSLNSKPPGDGWVQTGTKKVPTYAAPKNGGSYSRTVPIYTQTAQAAAPAPAPAPGPESPAPRDTGIYEDITRAFNEEIKKANDNAEKWKNELTATINSRKTVDNLDLIRSIQSAADQRSSQLEQMMLQQQAQAQAQQAIMQKQIEAAQAAYEEQRRQSVALSQAYVPAPNESAASAALGDQRSESLTEPTTSGSSKLSELAIVSGLGTNANPLAGLQLA